VSRFAILAIPAACLAASACLTPSPARSFVTQPAPPVTARAFPMERAAAIPVDGDGLIPNPATPTGAQVAPPSSCTVRFSSASGATSATVNGWIAAHENTLAGPAVVCLSGVFTRPLHVWGKVSRPLLEIAPAPHSSAELKLGAVAAADTDPNQYWADSGGISIVDSRSVEIYGLTVRDYHWNGIARVPAGIYVTVRSDTGNTNLKAVPHRSACFLHHGSCGDIYLIDNTVQKIINTADENYHSRFLCGNANVDGYGIAVIAAGSGRSPALQHLVIERNTVTGTRTGQSETVTINGDVKDFLVARNVIHDDDNIGVDSIGWELGSAQANHGLIQGNTVYNIDTWSNAAYGAWHEGKCVAQPENAAGIYDDGASYIWIHSNTVWNTDQGINLDVETTNNETDHLLVSGNTVFAGRGTSLSDPSRGANPPGFPGSSSVAGHDPFALFIDAFGTNASIRDVYAHDNVLTNQSQFYLQRSSGMPVLDLGGTWSDVQIWHNTISGLGPADLYNPLFEVDNAPAGGANIVNCNAYRHLSKSPSTVNGNFALPNANWLTLTDWRRNNKHGWDADSQVGGFSPRCPAHSLP